MKGLRPLHASPNGKNRFVNGLKRPLGPLQRRGVKISDFAVAVGEADLEAQRASNLDPAKPALRIEYEGAAAPSCIPKRGK